MSATTSMKASAIIAYQGEEGKHPMNLKLEEVTVSELKDDELLVKVLATGVCHTDLVLATYPDPDGTYYPRVLGHEGSGYVQAVGSKVTVAKVGDPVLLSFAACNTCDHCTTGHPAYCPAFPLNNIFGRAGNYTTADKPVTGSFFGQSSFSSLSKVVESSVVNVSGLKVTEEEMKLFSPLGCGIQTGAGTILTVGAAGPSDVVVVLGLGGVGLAGIMGAKIAKSKTIIGVDLFQKRLDMSKELGATHTILSERGIDLGAKIKEIAPTGATIIMDTTGVAALLQNAVDTVANRGKVIMVGIPAPGSTISIDLGSYLSRGVMFTSSMEGDSVPAEFIPKMIKWYRDGQFPLDKLISYFPAAEFDKAITQMNDGTIIKPVLVW